MFKVKRILDVRMVKIMIVWVIHGPDLVEYRPRSKLRRNLIYSVKRIGTGQKGLITGDEWRMMP